MATTLCRREGVKVLSLTRQYLHVPQKANPDSLVRWSYISVSENWDLGMSQMVHPTGKQLDSTCSCG
jgi:hypothetical protein